jgi:hypothetical protein
VGADTKLVRPKRRYLVASFRKKIVLEKSRVTTCEFTTPINVLISASKVLKSSDIKKEVENDLFSCMAPHSSERHSQYAEL